MIWALEVRSTARLRWGCEWLGKHCFPLLLKSMDMTVNCHYLSLQNFPKGIPPDTNTYKAFTRKEPHGHEP